MRTIVAARCTLEPLRACHADEMFAVLSDPAIYEFENAPPASVAGLRARYERLEARGPVDGTQRWLNWVVRLPGGALAGHVQATVLGHGTSLIAYELNSRYWRQGIGSDAVRAMLAELNGGHGVDRFVAVLKAANFRSRGLLQALGFGQAEELETDAFRDEADEWVMVRRAAAVF